MPIDLDKATTDYQQEIANQIAQQQQLLKPQGGVLNQIDPTWLALAQGFLAPTRTGSFGESISNAANQLQGPLSQIKQQQLSAQDKINNLKQLQYKAMLDAYKAQKGDEDSSLSVYRDLRNEDLINRRYDRLVKNQDSIIQNPLASEQDIAEAKRQKDAIEAERESKLSTIGAQKSNARPASATQPQIPIEQQIKKEFPNAYQENGKWFVVKDGQKNEIKINQ